VNGDERGHDRGMTGRLTRPFVILLIAGITVAVVAFFAWFTFVLSD